MEQLKVIHQERKDNLNKFIKSKDLFDSTIFKTPKQIIDSDIKQVQIPIQGQLKDLCGFCGKDFIGRKRKDRDSHIQKHRSKYTCPCITAEKTPVASQDLLGLLNHLINTHGLKAWCGEHKMCYSNYDTARYHFRKKRCDDVISFKAT